MICVFMINDIYNLNIKINRVDDKFNINKLLTIMIILILKLKILKIKYWIYIIVIIKLIYKYKVI